MLSPDTHKGTVGRRGHSTGSCSFVVVSDASDEITLILPEVTEVQRVHIYNGRTQKIASSVAGLCSARFNFHMCAQTFGPGEETLRDAVRSCRAYFDARVIAFPDKTEGYGDVARELSL